jgi:hypothetical protein
MTHITPEVFSGDVAPHVTAGSAGCSVGSRPQAAPTAVYVQRSTNTPADVRCWAAASTASTAAGVQVGGPGR